MFVLALHRCDFSFFTVGNSTAPEYQALVGRWR